MNIAVLTLFPAMFQGPFAESMVKRAVQSGVVQINVVNIRDFAKGPHRCVDDMPYGGGAGMVMKPEPLFDCVASVRQGWGASGKVVLLSPQGKPWTQAAAVAMAQESHVMLVCGHYEGFDERVCEHLADEEVSIGDYVLTGGEIPAMVVVDSLVRLLPGGVGNPDTHSDESFYNGLLEGPHYTRPVDYEGWRVPDVLLSGHHAEINKWRRQKSLERTWQCRPDLLAKAVLTKEDEAYLKKIGWYKK